MFGNDKAPNTHMKQILSTFRTWDVDNPYGYVILWDEDTQEKMAVKSNVIYPYFYDGMIITVSDQELKATIEANNKNTQDIDKVFNIIGGVS